MEISIYHLEILLRDAAEMGGRTALAEIGKLRPYLKKSNAFRIMGEAMWSDGCAMD